MTARRPAHGVPMRTLSAALSRALVLLPAVGAAALLAPNWAAAQSLPQAPRVSMQSLAASTLARTNAKRKSAVKATPLLMPATAATAPTLRAQAATLLADSACTGTTNCVIQETAGNNVGHEQPGLTPAAISHTFSGTQTLTAANGYGAIDFAASSGMGGTADTNGHHGGIGGFGAAIDPVVIDSGVTATGSAGGGVVRLVTWAGLGGGGQGAHWPYAGGTSGDGGGSGTVNLNVQGTVTSTDGTSPGIVAAGFGGQGGTGNNGGDDYNASLAGNGGGSDLVTVTIGGAVMAGGFGAQARGTGGAGGTGPKDTGGSNSSVGSDGGVGGNSTLLVQMTVNGSVTSTGADGIDVMAEGGAGGAGGSGASASTSKGGAGGAGGQAAPALATVAKDGNGNGAATVSGALIGVSVTSIGGAGGQGGNSTNSGNTSYGGVGGAGGAGGTATANIGAGASATGGTVGVLAESAGGAGGNGGTALATGGTAGAGGVGGAAGDAKVEVTGTVSGAAGASAIGVRALSSGGTGGTGAVGAGTARGNGGAGGTGGLGGTATVIVDSGASVTTTGVDTPKTSTAITPGVLVQSNGGVGGTGGDGTGAGAGGGAAGFGGVGGVATATIDGSVSTSGSFAHGVLAQSIGGAGAQAGDASAVFLARGGAAHNGGNAGTVYMNGDGTVTTTGTGAIALMGQSLGGGGGAGGNALAAGGGIAIGGNGGAGGNGGSVEIGSVSGDPASAPLDMLLTTRGAQSSGIVAQSIGGAGGNGGNAVAFSGIGFSLAIGGDGKGGGDGGKVTVQNDGVVTTFGAGSGGINAQSVGGGGGNGGAAIAISAGQISTAFALGGSGGGGGSGGIVTLTNNEQVTTYGSDAYGLKAQTIGGGGGQGGAATSVAVALQLDPEVPVPALSVAVSLGGSGGAGGDLSKSPLTVTNNGFVTTSGDGSFGIIAQSVAGGGGNGGDSSASAYSAGDGTNISASSAVGGSSKSGGTGGAVTVTNQGFILTLGESAHGVLAQSVGGGGGAGGIGDSSASAGAGENSYAGSVSVGGTGGTGGGGGTVTVNNNASIATRGDSARGVMAQSVGGGGGNSGGGAAKANGGDLSIAVTVGGNAGNGGNGGAVVVNNTASILTVGAEADAIFAQSIAGGGGTAGKGASTAGGAQSNDDMAKSLGTSLKNGLGLGQNVVTLADGVYKVGTAGLNDIKTISQLSQIFSSLGANPQAQSVRDGNEGDGNSSSLNLSATIGGSGGIGGTGGTVTVDNSGAVQTNGTKSDGIFAQSVGGGGGVGGASSFSGNLKSNDKTNSASLKVGASGTDAGVGGAVTVTNEGSASITTSGVTTYGINAQSVGGGGGKGGVEASKNGALKDLNVTLGGSGGTGGDGGAVTVNQYGAITTSGRFAIGALAQSVGGGGGLAHVLSSDTGAPSSSDDIDVTANIGGSGGAGGNGGVVAINMGTLSGSANPAAIASIATSGMGGIGLLGQSIGGGGGVLVTTSAVSDADGGGGGIQDSTTIPITVGGQGGATGNGGTVTIALSATSNSLAPHIVTSGADAYGILAQSIGGGGGLYTGTTAATADLTKVFTNTGLNGDGGAVNVSLNDGAWIYTSGAGGVGILAQSVGGGGGLFGGMSKVDLAAKVVQPNAYTEGGQGGNVTVDLENGGNIVTTGAKAHGIYAQSVGGGGGVIAQADGNGYAFAGGPYTGTNPATGSVTVTVGGNSVVRTSGEGAYGIFVQSKGNGSNDTTINVNAGGYVESWARSAAAIYVDGAGTNTINNAGTIDDGTATNKGKASLSGVAIAGNQPATVNNLSGSVINGATNLPVGASTFNNLAGAKYNAGATVELGAGGQLNNGGTLEVGGTAMSSTRIHGNLTQQASGQIVLDVDANGRRNDTLQVDGDTKLAGKIVLRPTSLTPSAITVLQTSGTKTDVADLVVTDVGGGRLFGYAPTVTGNGNGNGVGAGQSLSVTPYAKLLSSAQQSSFGAARVGAAGHLQQGFVDGMSASQGTLYAQLASLPTANSYRLALDNLSGEVLQSVAVSAHAASLSFAERMNNCPALDGPAGGANEPAREHACGWVRLIDNNTARDTRSDAAGFKASTRTIQFGGQTELGNGWLVGGSISHDNSTFTPRDTGGQISGNSTSLGLIVKREVGAWLFSGGVDYGTGRFDSQRVITIGTEQATASASFDMDHVGLHARAAWNLPQDGWYARPYVDAHAVRMHTSAFSETGAGDLNLNVQGETGMFYTLSPMVEIGTRRELDNGYRLRGFVAAGALLHAGDRFGAESALQGLQSSGATPFRATAALPNRQAKVNLGVDLAWKQSDLRFEYSGEFGDGYRSNTASVRLNVLF